MKLCFLILYACEVLHIRQLRDMLDQDVCNTQDDTLDNEIQDISIESPRVGDDSHGITGLVPQQSKIRRVMDTPEPREWMQTLHSLDNAHTVICRFSMSSNEECGIMQEPTHLVKIEDLPSGWPSHVVSSGDVEEDSKCTEVDANTVHLPCGHVFSTSALAFHFLVQDMRCPICRAGSSARMSISSVPLSIRHIYDRKLDVVNRRTVELQVSMNEVLQVVTQIDLQVLIRLPRESRPPRSNSSSATHMESLIHSRLLANDVDINTHLHDVQAAVHNTMNAQMTDVSEVNDQQAPGARAAPTDEPGLSGPASMAEFRTHRSFQRIIQSVVERQPPSTTIAFLLRHPLLPLEIRSVSMTVEDVRASLFDQALHGAIPLTCAAISGVEPIAYVQTSRDSANSVSNLSVRINLALVANMAIYVSQVLQHIAEAQRLAEAQEVVAS